jgi:hypothetical protein
VPICLGISPPSSKPWLTGLSSSFRSPCKLLYVNLRSCSQEFHALLGYCLAFPSRMVPPVTQPVCHRCLFARTYRFILSPHLPLFCGSNFCGVGLWVSPKSGRKCPALAWDPRLESLPRPVKTCLCRVRWEPFPKLQCWTDLLGWL